VVGRQPEKAKQPAKAQRRHSFAPGAVVLGADSPYLGAPGLDFPFFESIPETSFRCPGRLAGYYADPEANCQVSKEPL